MMETRLLKLKFTTVTLLSNHRQHQHWNTCWQQKDVGTTQQPHNSNLGFQYFWLLEQYGRVCPCVCASLCLNKHIWRYLPMFKLRPDHLISSFSHVKSTNSSSKNIKVSEGVSVVSVQTARVWWHVMGVIRNVIFLRFCDVTKQNGRANVGTLYRERFGEILVHYENVYKIKKGPGWGICSIIETIWAYFYTHPRFSVCFPLSK